ncbi:MAG: PIN domain-containing protein [Actinomycetota bacterium]
MTYVDASIVIAQVLSEDRRPARSFWEGPLVSSRLVEYEMWARINGRRLSASHGEAAQQLLSRFSFVELSPIVLARALEPFPIQVRTLDALHLASVHFLRERRIDVSLATYDLRMAGAARAMDLPIRAMQP